MKVVLQGKISEEIHSSRIENVANFVAIAACYSCLRDIIGWHGCIPRTSS